MFFIFPAATAWYFYSLVSNPEGKYFLKKKILCAVYSVSAAALLCAVYAFFVFSSSYDGTNLAAFSFYSWIRGFFVPALFYIFFILWSNDSWQERIDSSLCFALPFYSIYLPYFTLKVSYASSFFMGFVNPLAVVLAVFAICNMIGKFYRNFIEKNIKQMIITGLLIFAESVIPSVLTAFWFYGLNILLVLVLSAAFCALSVVLAGINVKPFVDEVKSSRME